MVLVQRLEKQSLKQTRELSSSLQESKDEVKDSLWSLISNKAQCWEDCHSKG
jgi:hypothetical protein